MGKKDPKYFDCKTRGSRRTKKEAEPQRHARRKGRRLVATDLEARAVMEECDNERGEETQEKVSRTVTQQLQQAKHAPTT
jgi:hypothetical protein